MKYLFLRLLLFPFGIVYILIIYIRNSLYDIGILKSIEFDVPVISVGNLRVGGTGKTPMTEYIASSISAKYKTGLLSRGYGRNTQGFRMVTEGESSLTVGDEPWQMFRKFGNTLSIAVGEDRLLAIPEMLAEMNRRAVIVMDDAFQHRQVKPSINIMLTSWSKPFYEDHILPYGMLREFRSSAKRADIIVVSKCPEDISTTEMEQIKRSVGIYAEAAETFFSYIEYNDLVPFTRPDTNPGRHILLVTGVADPDPLVRYINNRFIIHRHFKFPDHHIFSERDCRNIKSAYDAMDNHDKCVLMTEKDMIRISTGNSGLFLQTLPMFYIPIRFKFIRDGNIFEDMINNMIERFQLTP
ncbi:MAG TPA: tetraacyldisaccharide 4'-kinase [Cyclobacteriaceae bacterium]|nr:tetraacyldisaccharide 4'-kinase [Cyclobacteriaceae bacterium]